MLRRYRHQLSPERLRDGGGTGRSVSPGYGEITIGIQQIFGRESAFLTGSLGSGARSFVA
jgi:hypothetical protein